MPKPVVITTDSSADIPVYIREEFGIHYRPLYITIEDKHGLDSVDVFPADIYNAFQARGSLPKTAAASFEEYKEFFGQFTAQGAAVVHLSIGSAFSASFQSATIAAQEMEGEIYVVDSKQFCTGQGILAVRAAQYRGEGLEAAAIAERITADRTKVKALYYLHGLEFVAKSGRCPSVVAMGASLLNLHPGMIVANGEIVIGKKYRGKNAPANWLQDSCAKFMESCDPSLCFFMQTNDIPPEQYEALRRQAREMLPGVGRIVMDDVGCVIISHVGGNCYALIGMEK